MLLYNTLTKTKEELVPRIAGKINMFVCGPTVYDHIHIGNARTLVVFDTFAKYLRYKYGDKNVEYIVNITDIDNKIIDRAKHENVDALEYARKYTEIFKKDMNALGVTSPQYKNATDHVPEVVEQVQVLLDKGSGYVIEGDGIYFDLSTFPDYGKLSGRTANMADDAVSRIDDSDKKRNRGDFVLWKFKQDKEPSWPAPFGEGRPGWHIEDTAITRTYFGPQYDIHGGGQDLIFPHHEAEIAQQESASGLQPFVRYWLHVGFLVNKNAKMSKSLDNFLTLNEALKKYPREALRFYLLSAHYRVPLDFSESSIASAEAAYQRIRELRNKTALIHTLQDTGILDGPANEFVSKFTEAMDNDFNTPEALAALFIFIETANKAFSKGTIGKKDVALIINVLDFAEILGVIPHNSNYTDDQLPSEIKKLVDEREKEREKKDFEAADRIREQIKNLGHEVEDTPYGPLVKRIKF